MMPTYKAIFIDWDDTIGDFRGAEHAALCDLWQTYHLSVLYPSFDDYYKVYHEHNLGLWERYGRSEVSKDFLQFDRFRFPIRTMPQMSEEEKDRLAKLLGDDFLRLTSKYFRLLPDSAEVVRYLACKYPLTIVSNGFREVQYEKIRLSGLSDCFRHVVLSEEVGAQKPNPLIYERALELNGMRADEVLMIGDSWTSDIQGAIAAGIDQLWITRQEPDPRYPSTYRAQRLKEITEWL